MIFELKRRSPNERLEYLLRASCTIKISFEKDKEGERFLLRLVSQDGHLVEEYRGDTFAQLLEQSQIGLFGKWVPWPSGSGGGLQIRRREFESPHLHEINGVVAQTGRAEA